MKITARDATQAAAARKLLRGLGLREVSPGEWAPAPPPQPKRVRNTPSVSTPANKPKTPPVAARSRPTPRKTTPTPKRKK